MAGWPPACAHASRGVNGCPARRCRPRRHWRKEHGVALGTLRQALALLVAEGLLERQHGRGTFVRAGLGGASMLRFFRFPPRR
jgi:DNA-binding transcriptional MocR family regulator